TMVRTHTIQGTFCDPYYGGNADFVGWDLIGYPGIRTTVTAADQQMLERQQLKPNHRSAYDSEMFTKATASLEQHGDRSHADQIEGYRRGRRRPRCGRRGGRAADCPGGNQRRWARGRELADEARLCSRRAPVQHPRLANGRAEGESRSTDRSAERFHPDDP